MQCIITTGSNTRNPTRGASLPIHPKATTRRRDLISEFGNGRYQSRNYQGIVQDTRSEPVAPQVKGTQVTVSEGHPWHSRKRDKNKGDIGGDFSTTKQHVELSNDSDIQMKERSIAQGNPAWWTDHRYDGPIYPANFALQANRVFPPSAASDIVALNALGSTAIARCKPTNSVADASIFLGELMREGLPSLIGSQTWKTRTLAGRQAGSEYLNVQFGWLPIVDEIRKFAKAITHADAVLKQYERDAGRVVRRNYEFPKSTEVISETVITPASASSPAFISPGASAFYSPPYGDRVRTHTVSKRQWFSGAFTYYLPSDYNSRNGMARRATQADKLFGLSLTPDTVWNLTPWSWAVDWFSNTGDVISNLTDWATDGLVLQYGYIMETSISKYTYSMDKSGFKSRRPVPSVSFVTTTKQRRRATPFGFGLNWEALSPRQWSIITALGLSKGR